MGDVSDEFLQAVHEMTGVPKEFLRGDSIDAVWDSAARAEAWRVSTSAPPPTAAASSSMQHASNGFHRPVTSYATPGDIMAAYRAGSIEGVPQPPPRHTGEHGKNARP